MSYRDLRKLQDEWDAKLKAEGFNDIENRHFEGPDWIDRPSTDLLERYDPATAEYYRAAEEFCEYLKDKPEMSRRIWEMHAQGHSQIKIMRALKLARRRVVRNEVERLRKEMLAWWQDKGPEDCSVESDDEQIIAAMFADLSGVPMEDE